MIDTASILCDNLLNIYATRYDKFSENLKKRINVLNKPEMLILDFDRGDLPPMPAVEGDEEVKVEPEETIAERKKKNPQKRKRNRDRIKNFDSKLLTRLPIFGSANKSWK